MIASLHGREHRAQRSARRPGRTATSYRTRRSYFGSIATSGSRFFGSGSTGARVVVYVLGVPPASVSVRLQRGQSRLAAKDVLLGAAPAGHADRADDRDAAGDRDPAPRGHDATAMTRLRIQTNVATPTSSAPR